MNQETLEKANKLKAQIEAIQQNMAKVEQSSKIQFRLPNGYDAGIQLELPDMVTYDASSNEDYALAWILSGFKTELLKGMKLALDRTQKEFNSL